jgi:hypothetical protein
MIVVTSLLIGVLIGAALCEDHETRGIVALVAILGLVGLGLFALGKALA